MTLATCLMAAVTLVAPAAAADECTMDGPWDQGRTALARLVGEPKYVQVESVDGGLLLRAQSEWLSARVDKDTSRLESLTIPLPDQYRDVNRSWIEAELKRSAFAAGRPLLAQVDESNPFHAVVFSEVAMRVGDHCLVSSMGSDWIKLNGDWRACPAGFTVAP